MISIRFLWLVAAAIAMLSVLAPRSPLAHAGLGGAPDPGLMAEAAADGTVEVIVEVDSLASKGRVLDALAGIGHRQLRTYEYLPILALEVGPEGLSSLAAAAGVVSVSKNELQPASLASTIPIVNADAVQNLGWTGSGRTVVILDSGIDADHPFFAGRLVAQQCFSASSADATASLCPNGLNTDNSADIEPGGVLVPGCVGIPGNCDHGTHVAGIAGGAQASDPLNAPANGVAPGVNLIAIQVFSRFGDPDCTDAGTAAPCVLTSRADQISALNWVFGQVGNFNIDAVNMSLGGGNFAAACDGDPRKLPIDLLLAAGVATVISSGNNGFLNAVGRPGCISTAVTVGATDDLDTVTRNRGVLLDLFAPGSGVTSSILDDTYGNKGGTSMAAPHVAGAFAVMREAYPALTVAQILTFFQTTGVPITYPIDNLNPPTQTTTPRLDLLAALQAATQPPVLTADNDPVTVDEGDLAVNTGTFSDPDGDPVTLTASVGSVVDSGGGTWSWSWQTSDGPTDSQIVTITGTDDKGVTGEVTFDLIVENVAPDVAFDAGQVMVIDEGDVLDVLAGFTDPGWPDTYTSLIDWGTPAANTSAGNLVVTNPGPPEDIGEVSGSFQYGDNGLFTIELSVTDDDGGTGSDDFVLTVNNVPPTAVIDETGTVLINGIPTFLASAGDPIDFSGDSSDPGSDDLTATWDWDDGTSDSTTYLNDPPLADPFPSPEVNPRNITDAKAHAFGDACMYLIDFSSLDDDGGITIDQANVLIVGNTGAVRGAGYWYQVVRKNKDFSPAELDCLLAIANYVSQVFSEERAASTAAEATDVMRVNGTSSMDELFERQLLATLLNFANGAVGWDRLIDTDGDGAGDTPFADVITTAEGVRLDPFATEAELEAQKDLLEAINLGRA